VLSSEVQCLAAAGSFRTLEQAQLERQGRTLSAALQPVSLKSVPAEDIVALTGMTEHDLTRLLRMKVDAEPEGDVEADPAAGCHHDAGARAGAARSGGSGSAPGHVLEVPGSDCLWRQAAVSDRVRSTGW
jgi:hypothetical protein